MTHFVHRAIAIGAAAAGLLTAGSAQATGVTYAKDVAPILQKNCQQCHRPGEAAPMPMLTYDEVRPWVKSIRKVVAERTMPPWHADPSIGHWRNERRLADKDIATITQWADAGAPLGDPKDLPPAMTFTEGWNIGTPDMVFPMPKEEVLPPELKDEYRYVMIPTGLTQDRWVKAAEVRPGNLQVVHHVIVFIKAGGAAQGKGDGGFSGGLGGYAPGLPALVVPDGQGIFVPAGSALVLQMHYNKEPGTEARDKTTVGIKFCDKPVTKQFRNEAIGDMSFVIPPGAENHESTANFTAEADMIVTSLLPHMHVRGKDMKVWAKFPDGRTQDLLLVPKYDFNWQTAYQFAEPLHAPKGTEFFVKAHFDNSTKNPHNPDPTKEVRWGLPTYAEMMFAFMDYTLADEKLTAVDPGSAPGGGQ